MKSGYAAPAGISSNQFSGLSVVILATRWNTDIVEALVDGARRGLVAWGLRADQVRELRAPGAYELPLAADRLFERGTCDGIVTVGAVIRGDTPHFDFVAGECSRGLMDVQLRYGRPIGFGVLTVNDFAQAQARAGAGNDNKGFEAAFAMLEMICVYAGHCVTANMPQSRRGLSRRLTVQALYQWLVNEGEPDALILQFREQPEGIGRADGDYFAELLKGTVNDAATLVLKLSPHLDRPVSQLDPVEHAILLLGAYELQTHPEVPWKVVVNEAVNLAKMFGAEEGYKFVNGVLDKLAREVRAAEVAAGS